jgi:two-component system sensor histidine kinase RegB
MKQGLDWLLRLRWLAAATMGVFASVGAMVYGIAIPWPLVLGVMAVVAATNLFLQWNPPPNGDAARRWLGTLIFGDVFLLTILLYYTGGAHNPFTVLYVLHVTLAVMLLGPLCAWVMVGLCGAGFGLLFFSGHMLIGPDGHAICDDLDFHLQGMLAATVVTGAGVVYFVAHLNRSLMHQREVAAQAREAAEKERQFSSLLGMAAGVAHELATPLGTIALASHELEISSQTAGCLAECVDDVKLIRAEVDKCAQILERMSGSVRSAAGVETRPVRLDELQALLEHYLAPSVAARMEWRWCSPIPQEATIPGDDSLLILGNIIRNGWEAADGASPVVIEVRLDEEQAYFQISDQGPGMTPATLSRLGEPFFSTKKNHGSGMGLGFFLAQSMVEKLGGHVEVVATSPTGTSIAVVIPLLKAQTALLSA